METTENETGNSSSKPVTGVRTAPALKDALIKEAAEAGISLSEYCETVLYNRLKGNGESEQLAQVVAEQKKEIERLKAQVVATGGKQFEVVQAENEQLRKIIKEQNDQLAIYSDKRLLYLFDHLKGRKDTVENAYGDNFAITYQTPEHIIQALIYSTKLNQ